MDKISSKIIRKRCQEYAAVTGGGVSAGMRGLLIGAIEAALKHDGDEKDVVAGRRYLVFGWLFMPDDAYLQPLRSHELTDGQWYALKQWYGSVWTGEQWIPRPTFASEVRTVCERAALDLQVTENLILQNKLTDAIFGNLLGIAVPGFPVSAQPSTSTSQTEADILAELY